MSNASKDDSEEPIKNEDYKDVHLWVAFYDFCHCICLQSKAKSKDVKNTHEIHLGVLQWHALMDNHPLWETHELLKHINEDHGDGTHKLVPHFVSMTIPRHIHPHQWQLFVLAHFKSFSHMCLLIQKDSFIEEVFETYIFTS